MASAGGWMRWRKHDTLPIGTPCPNCGTPLAGPYCHECGQLGERFHRSLLHLAWEAVENFFHVDGRLLHTMPRLALHPGQLTKDYIEGHRAAQVPPLRMFLVVMLIFFFVGGLHTEGSLINIGDPETIRNNPAISEDVKESLPQAKESPAAARVAALKPSPKARAVKKTRFKSWLKPRLVYASSHPREFTLVFESWTHRIAIAMLPVAAAILSLLFVFRRKFYVFDHLIFSMHSLSFMGLLASVGTVLGLIPGLNSLADLLYFLAPVHLFVHMRGVYGTGIVSTLWRMFVLFLLSALALGLMLLAVLFIGLTEMDAGTVVPAPAAKAAATAKTPPPSPPVPAAAH
jgi:hypothetical protein